MGVYKTLTYTYIDKKYKFTRSIFIDKTYQLYIKNVNYITK